MMSVSYTQLRDHETGNGSEYDELAANHFGRGGGVGCWLGLGAAELKIVMILMACPVAVVSYTMALEMKGDEGLASGAVVLSVLTSLVTLAVIIGVF